MNITTLGEPRFPSPLRRTISDRMRVPHQIIRDLDAPSAPEEELRRVALPSEQKPVM